MSKSGTWISGALLLIAGILFGMSYNNMKSVDNSSKVPAVVQRDFSSKSLNEMEKSTISLFDNNVPSVAYITTTNLEKSYWSRNITEIPRGSGSGFIWDTDGHIVTNYHVIQGADRATVTLHDQSTYQAKLIGAAPDKDLAVLKIDAPLSKLIPIKKGESENLLVGQSVLAIGNPFGLDYTLTTGVISALGREINSTSDIQIQDVIQTDAAINPGNSGGPLINSNGELIGVNTAIYSPTGAYAGIGFSIPIDAVKWVVPDLILYGRLKRPVLGVELLQGTTAQDRYNLKGALIMNVIKGKGASKAGLQGTTRDREGKVNFGDLIVGINEDSVESNSDLVLALEDYKPGEMVKVTYIREGNTEITQVELGEN